MLDDMLRQLMIHTYGALFIGTLVATFASGTNALQTVFYFRLYPEDSRKLKVLVAAVLVLDIAHTGLLWADQWFFFVENFGDIEQIVQRQKSSLVQGEITVGMILALIVHLFYLRRVFDLSRRNYWISVPILILITVSASAFTVIICKYQDWTDFAINGGEALLSISFSCTATTDIAIMACLFVLLRSSRKRSISLNNAIDKIILYTIEMGSLTAFMAIAIMITQFAQQTRGSLFSAALNMPLAKAYACSFLGSLNTRYRLRRSRNHRDSHGRIMILNPKIWQPSPDMWPQDIRVDATRRIWNDDV